MRYAPTSPDNTRAMTAASSPPTGLDPGVGRRVTPPTVGSALASPTPRRPAGPTDHAAEYDASNARAPHPRDDAARTSHRTRGPTPVGCLPGTSRGSSPDARAI